MKPDLRHPRSGSSAPFVLNAVISGGGYRAAALNLLRKIIRHPPPVAPVTTGATGRSGIVRVARACRRSPVRTRASLTTRSARSRVAMVGDAPVTLLYFPAVSPPHAPPAACGKSASRWRSLMTGVTRSNRCLFMSDRKPFYRSRLSNLGKFEGEQPIILVKLEL